MKNLLFIGLWGCLTLTNCGSAAEAEKAKADFIANADSIRLVDSLLAQQASLAENINLNTKTPADKKFIKTAELKFKVNNVLRSTEKIEDIAVKYGGYITYSNLQNKNEDYKRSKISRDSLLVSTQIVVVNDMQLRIPNERLDSFVRELNPLVVSMDYRVIKLNDVTLQFAANQKRTERLQKHEQRQEQHIDKKPGKLKETTAAEENLLNRQNQADDYKLRSMALEDQVKYCDITINIYQKPIIVKEVVANFDYVSDVKPGFFARVSDSFVQGWWALEEVVVFLVKIWGILLLIVAIIFGIKYLTTLFKKIK